MVHRGFTLVVCSALATIQLSVCFLLLMIVHEQLLYVDQHLVCVRDRPKFYGSLCQKLANVLNIVGSVLANYVFTAVW